MNGLTVWLVLAAFILQYVFESREHSIKDKKEKSKRLVELGDDGKP